MTSNLDKSAEFAVTMSVVSVTLVTKAKLYLYIYVCK